MCSDYRVVRLLPGLMQSTGPPEVDQSGAAEAWDPPTVEPGSCSMRPMAGQLCAHENQHLTVVRLLKERIGLATG